MGIDERPNPRNAPPAGERPQPAANPNTGQPAAKAPHSQAAPVMPLTPRVSGVQRHYRAHEPHPGAGDLQNIRALPITSTILDWVGTGKRVLDLGCHDGDISALIRANGNDVIGVDLPEMVEVARTEHGIEAIAHDLNLPFPLPDASFDVVVAASVLDDIPDDLGFLRECHRVTTEGGSLIIVVPNEVSAFRRIQALLGRSSRNWSAPTNYHTLHCYTRRGISILVDRAGFHVVQATGCPKRFSRIPLRYHIERVLPATFSTDLAVRAVRLPATAPAIAEEAHP